jgi:hypothetical protein
MKQKTDVKSYVKTILKDSLDRESVNNSRHRSVDMDHLSKIGVKTNIQESYIKMQDKRNSYKKIIDILSEAMVAMRDRDELSNAYDNLYKIRQSLRKKINS